MRKTNTRTSGVLKFRINVLLLISLSVEGYPTCAFTVASYNQVCFNEKLNSPITKNNNKNHTVKDIKCMTLRTTGLEWGVFLFLYLLITCILYPEKNLRLGILGKANTWDKHEWQSFSVLEYHEERIECRLQDTWDHRSHFSWRQIKWNYK